MIFVVYPFCKEGKNEALFSDPRWEEVRLLAKAVLTSFGWPSEIPPPAREEHGTDY
jgi:hypothetical protein